MDRVSISEAAARYGVTVRALRFYEEAGLLAPNREKNGRRTFEEADCRRLEAILGAKKLGFSLAVIRRSFMRFGFQEGPSGIVESLYPHEVRKQIDLLEARRNEIEAAISFLRNALPASARKGMRSK